MGGAAGHIKNIWEIEKFNFYDINNIIQDSLEGKLKNPREKLDGQNFMLTYRNGKFLGARTRKHLRNYGDDYGITIQKIWNFFSPNTPDNIRDAFKKTMEQFENLLIKREHLEKIFQNGKWWFNMEILYEPTENIIYYGKNQIRIHNFIEINKNGKIVKIIDKGKFHIIMLLMEFFHYDLYNKVFEIKRTNNVIIKSEKEEIKKELSQKLFELWTERGLKKKNTIEDFIAVEIDKYILDIIPKNFPIELHKKLINRWVKKDKSINITQLLKNQNKDIIKWVKKIDQEMGIKRKRFFEPIINLISLLGIKVLKNLEELTTEDKKKSINKIKSYVKNAKMYIKKNLNSKDDKTIEKIKFNINLFNTLGGLNSITPVEGIVFNYNGELLKLTGSFNPLIQIIGFQKYSKNI